MIPAPNFRTLIGERMGMGERMGRRRIQKGIHHRGTEIQRQAQKFAEFIGTRSSLDSFLQSFLRQSFLRQSFRRREAYFIDSLSGLPSVSLGLRGSFQKSVSVHTPADDDGPGAMTLGRLERGAGNGAGGPPPGGLIPAARPGMDFPAALTPRYAP